MIGTIRWNFIIGLLSFAITFASSIVNNIWLTSLLRSTYSFLIVFALTFLFRWVLGTIAGLNRLNAPDSQDGTEEAGKGASFDATTPDEDAALHQLLKDSLDSKAPAADAGFAPLNPPKLSSKLDNIEPAEMAQAVRRMTDE